MPANLMAYEDMELSSVMLQAPLNRSLEKEATAHEEVYVETEKGNMLVAMRGDKSKPAILTFHDLGLNYVSNFQAFFNYPDMVNLLDYFCVYHVTAVGQEDGAEPLPELFEYPSMDEMAEQVNEVINHFNIVNYVGIGVGLGGNVLLRHALSYPERVHSLMLINTVCTAAGWIEWAYQKRNISHLRRHGVTQAVQDYLLAHHFGTYVNERAQDLVNMYKKYFINDVQSSNLAKLSEQYIWRTAVNIERENNLLAMGNSSTLKVPVLNIVGAYSPVVEETIVLNGKLSPSATNWLKIQDAAMVLEETPAKVTEAFRLFLQGQGFCLKLKMPIASQ